MTAESAPFRLDGGSVGMLLLHGFTGSPVDMRPLGEHLHRHGLTVICPLLPGHGTQPDDLNHVRWRDWYNAARRALLELRTKCDHVFVGGLSMGGALALHIAAHNPVDGVVTLATGLRPKDWRIPFVAIIKHLRNFEPKSAGEDIKDPAARSKFSGYQVWPTWGVHELVRLNNHVREDLPDITCPILIMHAVDDHMVPVQDATLIYEEVGSSVKQKIILENSWHVITLDYEHERVETEVSAFIQRISAGVAREAA